MKDRGFSIWSAAIDLIALGAMTLVISLGVVTICPAATALYYSVAKVCETRPRRAVQGVFPLLQGELPPGARRSPSYWRFSALLAFSRRCTW